MDKVRARRTICGTDITTTIEGEIYDESPSGLTTHGHSSMLAARFPARDYIVLCADIISVERNIGATA